MSDTVKVTLSRLMVLRSRLATRLKRVRAQQNKQLTWTVVDGGKYDARPTEDQVKAARPAHYVAIADLVDEEVSLQAAIQEVRVLLNAANIMFGVSERLIELEEAKAAIAHTQIVLSTLELSSTPTRSNPYDDSTPVYIHEGSQASILDVETQIGILQKRINRLEDEIGEINGSNTVELPQAIVDLSTG